MHFSTKEYFILPLKTKKKTVVNNASVQLENEQKGMYNLPYHYIYRYRYKR